MPYEAASKFLYKKNSGTAINNQKGGITCNVTPLFLLFINRCSFTLLHFFKYKHNCLSVRYKYMRTIR